MVPVYNISSAGGSATIWLASILNRHPQVVCLHALRDGPFHGQPIEPPEMVAGLGQLHDSAYATKCFGVIHSYYDAEIREPIKAAGGGFLAMLRHPIQRIHSLFVHHYRDIHGGAMGEDGVYATLTKRNEIAKYLDLFDTRVSETLYADLRNIAHVPVPELAVFERMTADAGYCRERLEILLDEDLADFEPVIAGMLGRKSNQHVARPQTPEEIFDEWPRAFRDCFQAYATRIGLVGTRNSYRRFGYDIAPMLVG